MKSNPAEYRRLKEVALANGRLARSEYLNPNVRDRWSPKQFSAEELQLLAEVPESESAKYYGAGAIFGAAALLSKMSTEEPERYISLRRVAQLRGQIETRPSQPIPEPKPANPFFELSDEIADQAGLPRGYQTNADGLTRVLKVILEVKERKAAAAAQAAKSTQQLELDRLIDSSVADYGRVLTKNEQAYVAERRSAIAADAALERHDAAKVEVPVKA
jgi:hypothetical protein